MDNAFPNRYGLRELCHNGHSGFLVTKQRLAPTLVKSATMKQEIEVRQSWERIHNRGLQSHPYRNAPTVIFKPGQVAVSTGRELASCMPGLRCDKHDETFAFGFGALTHDEVWLKQRFLELHENCDVRLGYFDGVLVSSDTDSLTDDVLTYVGPKLIILIYFIFVTSVTLWLIYWATSP